MCWCCPTATRPTRSPPLLAERFALPGEPRLVRDALAGEDDAEDAQWLVVVEAGAGALDPAALDELAEAYDGWLEEQ